MSFVEVARGDGPVVMAFPHAGTDLPAGIADRLRPEARILADTDWHVDRLYEGLLDGATTVRTAIHRYVVDANRSPDGTSLYPGRNTTGLAPMTDFDGRPLWTAPPDPDEVEARRAAYHAPYHASLEAELARVRAMHGVAILYDCHSIRSRVPFLFDGRLPDLNIGTNDGASCAPALEAAVADACARAEGYSSVVNGRFKGGWTTRRHGRPAEGVHAVQMELSQATYLARETEPFDYDAARAERLRPHLKSILETLADMAPSLRARA